MSFKKLIETAKQGQQEREEEFLHSDTSNTSRSFEKDAPDTPAQRRTRRLGKRSNPDYVQALSYLPEALYLRVKQELLNPVHGKKDYSDLVAELLSKWMEEQK